MQLSSQLKTARLVSQPNRKLATLLQLGRASTGRHTFITTVHVVAVFIFRLGIFCLLQLRSRPKPCENAHNARYFRRQHPAKLVTKTWLFIVHGLGFSLQITGRKFHKTSKAATCAHRRHHKLELLRTLVLGDNLLSAICLWLDEGGDDDGEAAHKSKLLFPNLTALDVSNNKIREIPNAIHELVNLSVFNLGGNPGKTMKNFQYLFFGTIITSISFFF